jgi:hypothetical protein
MGRGAGATLVVYPRGFARGPFAATVAPRFARQVVARYTPDAAKGALKRDYVAEDPVNFTDQYAGTDTVMVADAPYAEDRCEELAYRNYAEEARR